MSKTNFKRQYEMNKSHKEDSIFFFCINLSSHSAEFIFFIFFHLSLSFWGNKQQPGTLLMD